MSESDSVRDAEPQLPSTVELGGEHEEDLPPSCFVEVQVTHRLEVTDLPSLRTAVEALHGPSRDELDERLREVPANLVGWLFQTPFPDLPGVVIHGSSLSAGEYTPETHD